MQALWISREACREFALRYSWENSARQFIGHVQKIAVGAKREAEAAISIAATAPQNPDGQGFSPDRNPRVTHEHSV
jgi:hypothetical protein